MDTSKVLTLLEQLDDEIDGLEESIAPLVATALSETASKLPLLDQAKLYVLVTYAIESVLFSYLRLNGVNARSHPVFTELTRVKQYFEKIKLAENPVGKRENLTLDKAAATRIIRAGLSGNDKYDLERAEQQAKERAKAHIKFQAQLEKEKQDEISKKRNASSGPTTSDSDSDSDSDSSADGPDSSPPAVKTKASKVATPANQHKPSPKSGISSASEHSSGSKRKARRTRNRGVATGTDKNDKKSKRDKKNKRRKEGAKSQ